MSRAPTTRSRRLQKRELGNTHGMHLQGGSREVKFEISHSLPLQCKCEMWRINPSLSTATSLCQRWLTKKKRELFRGEGPNSCQRTRFPPKVKRDSERMEVTDGWFTVKTLFLRDMRRHANGLAANPTCH
jgi:hypothetical protein